MREINCEIKSKYLIDDKEYFELIETENGQTHIIPTYQLNHRDIEIGEKYPFIKKFNNNSQRYFLEIINKPISLEIVGSSYFINNKGESKDAFIVKYKDKEIKVACFVWQNSKNWKEKNLICTLERFSQTGEPILKNKDYRHPYFKWNKVYDFKITGTKKKTLPDKEINLYILEGEDNKKYEVFMLPGQLQNQLHIKSVKCRVTEITHIVKLKQVDFQDPFFLKINEIVKEKSLIKKYFDPIFNNQSELNEDEIQLIEQYEAGSAFWVFTYANKLLQSKFRDSINQFNYKDSIQIISLLICFETWIIKKGILTSIKDELLRARTQKKAQQQLDLANLKENTLQLIIDNEYTFLEAFLKKDNITTSALFHLMQYANPSIINDKILFEIINTFLSKNLFIETEHYTTKLLQLIYRQKKSFINENEIEAFNLTTRSLTKTEIKNNSRYLNWSFFEYIIYRSLDNTENSNIIASQIIRGLSLSETSFETKQNLLFNAYYYLENVVVLLNNPFEFEEGVIINTSKLHKQEINTVDQTKAWSEISESISNNTFIEVQLKAKSDSGFDVYYKDLKGFLPAHHVSTKDLRNYGLDNCDFTTNVTCLSMNTSFKYFIVEQLKEHDANYLLENKLFTTTNKGDILEGKVKAIMRYGIFVSTNSGEGLIHISDIFDFYWDVNDIYDYFQKGQTIRVVVKGINNKNQISFSLSEFKSIDNHYYQNLVKQTIENSADEDYINDNITRPIIDIIQNEKAFCFEQLALFQFDIREKINSFRVAKQFYSNTNSAKSYLINIYTSYFDILLSINTCLEKRQLIDFESIQAQAKIVEERIHAKTLETFPEVNKLIVFLRIIQLFNIDSKESFDELYSYVIKYSNSDNTASLRTISKITLSNNLMTSEINDNKEFIFKNLNLIYQFLANGILTLSESDNDKYHREMKEKIEYLKQKIASDESETLEFKASLYKPYPDQKRLERLEILKKQKQDEKIKREIDRINGNLAKKAIIHEAFKNLCAFANTNGGTLLIGVNDDQSIQGIENEFQSISGKKQNKDGYGLRFDDLIKEYFGNSFSSLLKREIIDFPEGSVFVVEVATSTNEVFLNKDEEGKPTEELYIRNYSSAQCLSGKSLVEFIKNKHIEQLKEQVKN